MPVTLDWLGCATFRLVIDDLVVFLDAYVDRVPAAPPVGLRAAEVERADYVLVGHSHFDHIAGAEVIARNTGAKVIGSNESVRVLLEAGVAESQLLRAQGGERFGLGEGVQVRVLPSLHSCVWAPASWDPGEAVTGQSGLSQEEREGARRETGGSFGRRAEGDEEGWAEIRRHLATCIGSREDGGALAYVIETQYGSIFYQDTSGCWTGVLQGLRPEVALIAMAARPNVDGEPIQGSLAQYVGLMADLLRPKRVLLGHHDAWMPPMTRDMSTAAALAPVREELKRAAPGTELARAGYLEGLRILG